MNFSYPVIYIVLLNWNGWKDTIECLESIFRLRDIKYIVIICDNNSKDNSLEKIKQWAGVAYNFQGDLNLASELFNTFTLNIKDHHNSSTEILCCSKSSNGNLGPLVLIQNDQNLGFAGGNNVGIQFAIDNNADYIWILNNDTTVASDCLSQMINVAESSDDIGIVGSKIYFADNTTKIWFAGAHFFRYLGKSLMLGYGEKDNMHTWEDSIEADFITGCSMLIKTNVIEKVGFFDTDFFFTIEDLELSLRCQTGGYRCVVARQAKLWHKVSASTGGIKSPLYSYYYIRNRLLLMKKIGTAIDWITFFPYFLISQLLRYLLPSFLNKPTIQTLLPTYYAIRDFYQGKFGEIPKDVRTKIIENN